MTLTREVPTRTPTAGPVVGMLGGGQLARMCHQAAIPLGIELRVLCADLTEGAGPVVPGAVEGDPEDAAVVLELARGVDVLTLDHELVDLELLERVMEAGTPVRPGPGALTAAVDKLELRRRLGAADLPVPRHVELTDPVAALPDWEGGWVVKTARGGYDGRGVWFPDTAAEVAALTGPLLEDGHRVIVEERIVDPVELAVLVARRPGGETVVYDPVRTYQRDGICIGLEAPAGVDPEMDREVRALAEAVVAEVGAVGVCAVELLVDGSRVLVSEIAARPHNSAHHTIDAAITSQFENHLRGVLDLPLGSGVLAVPGAGMANLLGTETDPRSRLAEAMEADPEARIHLYEKRARPGRKLGHVTVVGPDPAEARRRAGRVATILGGIDTEEAT